MLFVLLVFHSLYPVIGLHLVAEIDASGVTTTMMYSNIGAPCNVCEPPDPYASIARMKPGRQPADCNKSSPPLRLSDIVYFRMDASARPELTRGTLSNKTMSSRYVMYSRT